MKKFYITGTSSGIGKALAEAALAEGHFVVGIARRLRIEHPNYRHLSIDLSDLEAYSSIGFDGFRDGTDELILINNAGTLGSVKAVAQLDPRRTAEAYQLNLLAPTLLSKLFLENLGDQNIKKTIINISSGAGSYPIKSWSVYCASKAGLDMFSEVLKLDHPEVRCHAISPGIVDTEMQGEIRRTREEDFPDRQRFVEYKENKELSSAEEVAQKIIHVIKHPEQFSEVRVSLRQVELPKA
ncbi:MAG: SDR family NAD(P)-dependent oxidoreductase [Bacteroidetes bacterium]|nr:SDR family NAD(P)-dependent oxidoreductase [Bacteroidota bacterium]